MGPEKIAEFLGKYEGAQRRMSIKAQLNGLLMTVVEGLNDNWSVQLLDKKRPWPNHRALPIRDGKAYAELVEAFLRAFTPRDLVMLTIKYTGGMPRYKLPFTRHKGSQTLAPLVRIATRA